MAKRTGRVKTQVRRPGAVAKEKAVGNEAGRVIQERPPRPDRAKHYARKRFARALPEICDTYAAAAIAGDIASLKALIALAGFDRGDAHTTPATRRGRSRAKMLVEDLRKNPSLPARPEPGDWVDE